jgi:ornithine cyclodeaminase/alanine dehydrogenase-like protein (mu-crystallin family)
MRFLSSDDVRRALFKSVGNAVQDFAATIQVPENSSRLGLGTLVPF